MHRSALAYQASLVVTFVLVLAACDQREQTTVSSQAAAVPIAPAGTAVSMTAADCDRLPDPKISDDSPAGQAAAASQGSALRAACQKTVVAARTSQGGDLARIRQIMEKEEVERDAQKAADLERRRRMREAANAPIKDYKY